MDLTQELITFVATEVNGTTLCNFNENEIDLGNWQRLTMREAVIRFWPSEYGASPVMEDFEDHRALGAVRNACPWPPGRTLPAPKFPRDSQSNSYSRTVQQGFFTLLSEALVLEKEPLGKSIANLFEHVAEEHLIQPTIIYDFPLAVSPLSKQKPDDPTGWSGSSSTSAALRSATPSPS